MELEKLPPHNIDAEENVIGSLLIDGDLIHGLTLHPSDFTMSKTGGFLMLAWRWRSGV